MSTYFCSTDVENTVQMAPTRSNITENKENVEAMCPFPYGPLIFNAMGQGGHAKINGFCVWGGVPQNKQRKRGAQAKVEK